MRSRIARVIVDARGMTLVEVLMAIAILVIGIVALMKTLSAGYLDVVAGGGQSRATAYARQQLEQFRNQPFTPGPASGSDTPGYGMIRTWTILPVGSTVAPNRLVRMIVTVTWPTGSGGTQTTTLETMRAE